MNDYKQFCAKAVRMRKRLMNARIGKMSMQMADTMDYVHRHVCGGYLNKEDKAALFFFRNHEKINLIIPRGASYGALIKEFESLKQRAYDQVARQGSFSL
jgi:hypothetical protein